MSRISNSNNTPEIHPASGTEQESGPEAVFANKSVNTTEVLPEQHSRMETAPPTTPLTERQVETAPALKQLQMALHGYQVKVDRGDTVLLDAFKSAPAIKRWVQSGHPIPKEALTIIEQALPGLSTLVLKGISEKNLQWRIDSLLSEPLNMNELAPTAQLLMNTCKSLSKAPPASPQLLSAIDSLKTALNREDLSTKEHCGVICKAIDKAANMTSSEGDREILLILRRQVRDVALQAIKEEFKEKLHETMKVMERGGSQREVAVAIELGLAASAFGLDALGTSIKVEYSFSATAQDNVSIYDAHTVSTSLSLTAGTNAIARADAGITGSVKKGKLFSGVDAHINYHANDLLPMLFSPSSLQPHARLKTLRGVIRSINADRSDIQVRAEQERLQSLLHARGILHPGQHLTRANDSQKAFLEARSWQARGTVGATALEGMLSGEFHVANTHSEFFKRYQRLSALKASPEKLDTEPDRYFSVQDSRQWLPGEKGRQWIRKAKSEIETLKKELAACQKSDPEEAEAIALLIDIYRDNLCQAMASLYVEFDHYCSVVNQFDSGANPELKEEVRTVKHKMEAVRGGKNRGEYIRAVIDTHTAMASIYRDSFTHAHPPQTRDLQFLPILERFELDYEKPRLTLSENRHIRKHLSSFSKASSQDIEGGGKVRVAVGPVAIDAYFRLNDVRKHFSPDMEGRYLNIGFSAGAGTNPQSALNAVLGGIPATVTRSAPLFLDSLPENFAYGIQGNLKMEVNYIWSNGGWRVQYIRASNKTGIGGGIPELTIPAAPGVGVVMKTEAAVRAVNNIWERVGTNTLTYFYTRYNGWAMAGKIPEHWESFKAGNPRRIKDLFHNLATADSNARKEFQEKLAEIGDKAFSDELNAVIHQFHSRPSDENYQSTLERFDDFMAKQHELYLKVVQSNFKPV
ncbi:MAG: hypothetical protein ACR2PT_11910 [Endozoicomonas sp.]